MRSLVLALCFAATPLLAHEGLHEQLDAATRRIEAEPRNAEARLARAELYRLHHEWQRARADYAAAAKLDASFDIALFARGRMELEAGNAPAARAHLDRFLAAHPQHADAHLMRARALLALGNLSGAIADYDSAVAHARPPNPDLYFERARVLAAHGRIDDALRGLDEGLAQLGMLVSLQRQAIDIAVAAGRIDDALRRLDVLAASSPKPELFARERAALEAQRR